MSKLKNVSNRLAGNAGMTAGTAFAAGGIVQLVHSQRGTGSKVVGLSGHLTLSFFIVGLLLMVPAVIALARCARPGLSEKVALAVAGSTALLGLTSISSLVLGHDGAWFNVIAPATNAVWVAGSVALAVSLKRAGRVPLPLVIGLPVSWVGIILGATVGGGLIGGAYFLALGHLLAQDALERRNAAIARAASA